MFWRKKKDVPGDLTKALLDAEKGRKPNVQLRYKDLAELAKMEPKEAANVLKPYLEHKGEYVTLPRKQLSYAIANLPGQKSQQYFLKRLEHKVEDAAGKFVTLQADDFRRLMALEPKNQKTQMEHVLSEQKGKNVKVLAGFLEQAIEAYNKQKLYGHMGRAAYKAAALALLIGAFALLMPQSLTGYAVFSSQVGKIDCNFFFAMACLLTSCYLFVRKS